MGYKTAQEVVIVLSAEEYYFGNVTSFDPLTGLVDIAWWKYDEDEGDTEEQVLSGVALASFGSDPCAFDLQFANHGKGGIYMASKDPRTWTVGVQGSKDEVNNTVTLNVYNASGTPDVITAPYVTIPSVFPFAFPNPLFGVRDDIADWITNN